MDRAGLLLVDDDAEVRSALGALLARLPGCRLRAVVDSGSAAVGAVARLRPRGVVIDAELPEALATVALLRAAAPSLRIVLLSTYGRARRAALASGADAYLLKDCGPCALAAALGLAPLRPNEATNPLDISTGAPSARVTA